MNKDFYVYEWFNVETGEVFYVGKGRKNRYKIITQRNQYFKNYYNKYLCDVRKVKTSLNEKEAFELEIQLIKQYKEIDQCKTNITLGGEGSQFEEGSWNDLFRKLQFMHACDYTSIMRNEDEYHPFNLKNKSLKELEEMYEDYYNTKDGIHTFETLLNDEDWEDVWED